MAIMSNMELSNVIAFSVGAVSLVLYVMAYKTFTDCDWLKQLFCLHEWVLRNTYHVYYAELGLYRCCKCHKLKELKID